jgi:hypothetical protein
MARIGCLIKGVDIMGQVQKYMYLSAAKNINKGMPYGIDAAFTEMRKKNIEIDAESVAYIYENTFNLNDGNFSSQDDVDHFAARDFDRILDGMYDVKPLTGTKVIGRVSPGRAAANSIAKTFSNLLKMDNTESTLMQMFKQRMTSAAKGMTSTKAFRRQIFIKMRDADTGTMEWTEVSESRVKDGVEYKVLGRDQITGDFYEFESTDKSLLPKVIANKRFDRYEDADGNILFKKLPDDRNMEEILNDAFALDTDEYGYKKIDGTLNSAIDVFNEFKAEVERYIEEQQSKGTVTDSEKALLEQYMQHIIDKNYDLILNQYEISKVVNDALINAGYYRTGKDGKKKLDWKKLTDAAGSRIFLKEQVDEVLIEAGFTSAAQRQVIARALEREYINLRKDIIKKRLFELENRNTIRPKSDVTSSAKQLSKLYSYGWFEEVPSTYGKIVNSMLGLTDVDQETFDKLEELGAALKTLYSFKSAEGVPDEEIRYAINTINELIGTILRINSSSRSKLLNAARLIQSALGIMMRQILNTLRNAGFQNQISGIEAMQRTKLVNWIAGETNDQIAKGRKQLSNAVVKDIIFSGGLQYGELSNLYMNRTGFDRGLNKFITTKITNDANSERNLTKFYHATLGTVFGRTFLEATDSYYKASITRSYFVHNLVKLLKADSTKDGGTEITTEEAMDLISQSLHGNSFDDAMITAKQSIDNVNLNYTLGDKKILPDNQAAIIRLANDIVMTNVVQNTNLTADMVVSAYNAAYVVAGRELGHVPNNPISIAVQSLNSKIAGKIDNAVKLGNYTEAAMWTMSQTFNNAILNPFIGGGTNWLVLIMEQAGLGILTGYASRAKYRADGRKIDITTIEGINQLQDELIEQGKIRSKFTRGIFGTFVSMTVAGLWIAASVVAGDDDDEALDKFIEWRESNGALFKYNLDEARMEWLIMYLGMKTGNPSIMLNKFLKTDLDRYTYKAMMLRAAKAYNDGKISEAEGIMGEIIGKSLRIPIPTMAIKQGNEIFDNMNNIGNYNPPKWQKSRGFWDGFFKGGALEYFGIMDFKGKYDIGSLPGVGKVSMDRLKEAGFNNLEDLNKIIKDNPGMDPQDALSLIRYTDKNGADRAILDAADREKIEEILMNKGKENPVKLSDAVTDEVMINALKDNDINTMYNLIVAYNDDNKLSTIIGADGREFTKEELKIIKAKIKEYQDNMSD